MLNTNCVGKLVCCAAMALVGMGVPEAVVGAGQIPVVQPTTVDDMRLLEATRERVRANWRAPAYAAVLKDTYARDGSFEAGVELLVYLAHVLEERERPVGDVRIPEEEMPRVLAEFNEASRAAADLATRLQLQYPSRSVILDETIGDILHIRGPNADAAARYYLAITSGSASPEAPAKLARCYDFMVMNAALADENPGAPGIFLFLLLPAGAARPTPMDVDSWRAMKAALHRNGASSLFEATDPLAQYGLSVLAERGRSLLGQRARLIEAEQAMAPASSSNR
jgi:hypothetical protein